MNAKQESNHTQKDIDIFVEFLLNPDNWVRNKHGDLSEPCYEKINTFFTNNLLNLNYFTRCAFKQAHTPLPGFPLPDVKNAVLKSIRTVRHLDSKTDTYKTARVSALQLKLLDIQKEKEKIEKEIEKLKK